MENIKAIGGHMKRWCAFLLSVVCIAGVLAACASIVRGPREKITITSTRVPAARVTIVDTRKNDETVAIGITPFRTSLPTGSSYFRAARYKIIVEAPGYAKREILLPTSVRTRWYGFGNTCIGVIGTPIGWLIVDPPTGAMYTFDVEDQSVVAELSKSQVYVDPASGELTIVLLEALPEALRAEMVEIR
jgi:hypothetical protein